MVPRCPVTYRSPSGCIFGTYQAASIKWPVFEMTIAVLRCLSDWVLAYYAWSCKCCCELGLCLARSAHVTRAQYHTISGHRNNRKVVDSAIDMAISPANLPNRYSALRWRPVTHAQTWASYSAVYRFGRLSISRYHLIDINPNCITTTEVDGTIWSRHGAEVSGHFGRLPVNSSHGQLVTRSTRHTVNLSQVNSSPGRLVTQSTRHKEAVNSSQANKQANIKAVLGYTYP